jgi:hypothetical protein
MGAARPGDMGIDVVHLNLHKTFPTPHGAAAPARRGRLQRYPRAVHAEPPAGQACGRNVWSARPRTERRAHESLLRQLPLW